MRDSKMDLISPTPIETHVVRNYKIFVKREDLSAPPGAPPFSKIRGLFLKLSKLKKEGFQTVGYTETAVSMAGWGVAWVSACLNINCVIFCPQYKNPPPLLQYHQKQWEKNNAIIRKIPAGRAKVGWYISNKMLKQEWPDNSILLPLGLPFLETIEATQKEANKIKSDFASIVVNVGSGTILAGLLSSKSFKNSDLYGIMGRKGNIKQKRKHILSVSGSGGFFNPHPNHFYLIDPGWNYTEKSEFYCPFPCHPWYDLKAWEWLICHIKELKEPVLFWNIGHLPKDFIS